MQEKPTHIVIHFGEVILKGANRAFFERALLSDVAEKLAVLGIAPSDFEKGYGRAIIALREDANTQAIKEALQCVPGVANFAFAHTAENDIESITEETIALAKTINCKSFAIETHRAHKEFPLTSQEANERVGAEVQKETGWQVDLEHPDCTLFIEITDKSTFLYTEKLAGMGGLPHKTSGRGIALLSGGIDSPVAAYKMLARGMTISAVHFHSLPKTSPESIEKVRTLLRTLACVQPRITLYLVPLVPVQQQIVKNCPDKLRVVIQRRFMARIAERIAIKEKAQALISGDALGQVASQTIENLSVTERAIQMPIFRPLVGGDKQSIVDIARAIGTYETSISPHEDCCTAFTPDKPETKARLADVESAEESLDIEKLVEDAVQSAEEETIS